jgi:hypothetical protein
MRPPPSAPLDDHPHIAFLFPEYPAAPPALCDTEMQALEAAGFHLTIASLGIPADWFHLQRPAALKAEILYPPPRSLTEWLRLAAPQDESWRAMARLAAEHAIKYPAALLPRGLASAAWFRAPLQFHHGVASGSGTWSG